jgi:hypothetical protein
MKALSVRQPWATLLVEGLKTVEVRSRPTKHRGKLAICASKTPRNIFWLDPVDKVPRLLHAGCVIGIVNVLDCRPMLKKDARDALVPYSADAYAWMVEPVTFCKPVPFSGRLGLYDVPDELLTPIANDETDWVFNYPCPQGDIKYTESSPSFTT